MDADTNTDTATLSEDGARWQVDLGAVRHIRQVEVWNDASSSTADIVTDDATVHVSGKALRPTVVNLDSRTRTVRIVTSGTGRVALSQVRHGPGCPVQGARPPLTPAAQQPHTYRARSDDRAR